jgi:ankyrin repeat protein
VLLDAGAVIDDPLLRAVLLDEPTVPAGDVQHPLSIVAAYTCCRGVTALHLCAEFNSVRCARALLAAGVDVNTRAAVDENGFGGQTPLFHTVNSNGNYSRPMLELLIDAGADLDVRLKGLKWGEGMDWETLLFDVTVFSYAQCGLYRQFHRQERDIYSNLALMYERRYRSVAPIRNVPNKYLAS